VRFHRHTTKKPPTAKTAPQNGAGLRNKKEEGREEGRLSREETGFHLRNPSVNETVNEERKGRTLLPTLYSLFN